MRGYGADNMGAEQGLRKRCREKDGAERPLPQGRKGGGWSVGLTFRDPAHQDDTKVTRECLRSS